MPLKFNPFTGNFDIVNAALTNPLQFQGSISANSDFPTSAEVENGWFYTILVDVTDNDASKTNTGQSFTVGDEIAWNGVNWTILGNENDYVPYTGATGNVDLGAVDLTTIGTLSGGTLTDGTATLTGGALTGVTGGIQLDADNAKLSLGAGDDMSLWFDGLNGRIDPGSHCVLIGEDAGKSLTTGSSNYNIFIGKASGESTTSGLYNVGIGVGALNKDVTGSGCIALGQGALHETTSSNSIGIGFQASYYNTGIQNIAMGFQALRNSITPSYNVAIGNYALAGDYGNGLNPGRCVAIGQWAGHHCGGDENILIGYASGSHLEDHDKNIFIGSYAGRYMTANENVGIGYQALRGVVGNSTGTNNFAFGNYACSSVTTGYANTAIGNNTLQYLDTGYYNLAMGYLAGRHITSGLNNICIGYNAGTALNTGQANVCLGSNAGPKMTTGSNNFALGNGALYANVTGGANIAIGNACMYNMEGAYGVAIGGDALRECTTHANTALGKDALRYPNLPQHCVAVGNAALAGSTTTSPTNNTAVGDYAGNKLEGSNNALIGYLAGSALTAESGNIAIGVSALGSKDGSSGSTAVGQYALRYVSGDESIGIGTYAGRGNAAGASGGSNIFVGTSTALGHTTAANNVCIGIRSANALTIGSNNIFLGYYSGSRQSTNSNLLIIDNQARADIATEASNAIIYGVMAAAPADQTLTVNAELNVQGNIQPTADDTYYIGKNDDDTPFAWKGVILKDTTDGKYYKIEVINGVVTATDLTD